MSAAPQIKGWCPGALRPMMSGDGLVVRIRPPLGRLSSVQARGIAALSGEFGNGVVDLSNRANVQLRGVAQARYQGLIDGLKAIDLIDADAEAESRRNILATPFRKQGDLSDIILAELTAALAKPDAPTISAKFGYAVDAGEAPVLQGASADVRLEAAADGGLLLCAADHPLGKLVTRDTAVSQMLELAQWCAGKVQRLHRLLADGGSLPSGFSEPRQSVQTKPSLGLHKAGALVASAFGQFDAETLSALAQLGVLRVTPWRMLLVEGLGEMPSGPKLITDPDDPMLRVVACVGAPACAQGQGETRAFARGLAGSVPPHKTLHVSGCTKGCAHPSAADIVLTASSSGFTYRHNATADATPTHTGLTATDISDLLQKAP